MACRVIERASSACGEVARAAAGTIEYNCDGYRPSVTVRAVQDTPADLERTLFGRSDLKRSRKRRRVCPENPPHSLHRGLPIRTSTPAQTAVANSQRHQNVRASSPDRSSAFCRSLPDSPAVSHCVARERGGGPRTLPVAHSRASPARLRALARRTPPRRSFVRTRRPGLHLGRENSSPLPRSSARGVSLRPLGVRGIAGTARRRAGVVCAAYPRYRRAHSSRGEDLFSERTMAQRMGKAIRRDAVVSRPECTRM